jgi:hypothetical protein
LYGAGKDVDVFGGEARERKLRLFAVACCRRIWPLLDDERSRWAVEVAEKHADGGASSGKLDLALRQAFHAVTGNPRPAYYAAQAANLAASDPPPFMATLTVRLAAEAIASSARRGSDDWNARFRREQLAQADLLRDIIGNPDRPVTLDPYWLTWRDGLVVSMAQRMYDSRDFSDMPVLADALEDAGCSDPDILGHCRSGSEHVRGCWVLDLVLDKS